MRTPDMSDEELDALFQRSAENYPDEHNLSAWLQMERKLDEAAVQHLVRRRVLRLFVIETLIVALGLLLWLGLRTPAAQPPLAAASSVAGAAASPAASAPAAPATAATGRHQKSETAITPIPTATPTLVTPTQAQASESGVATAAASTSATRPTAARPAPSRLLLIAPILAPSRKPRATYQSESSLATTTVRATPTPAAAARKHPALSRSESGAKMPLFRTATPSAAPKSSVPTPENSQPESSLTGSAGVAASVLAPASPTTDPAPRVSSETVAPEAAVAAAPQSGSEPLPGRTSGATPADTTALPTTTPLLQPAAASPTVATAPTDSTKPASLKPQYRLSVGLVLAPELSTVRWVQGAGLGSNVGVLLEYRLTNRLRINVAALRSLKRYSARGSDYHPPAGYWSNNYTIDRIDATCRITDLPLNLRYDLVQRPSATIFASAGLSTLLMRSERYIYAYEYYGKPASRDWTLLNGSNHYLSVVNLSAGYERTLHGRWSAQAEPFVKIPLGGVGFGKIKLSSAGVFFSLKYGLVPAAPRPSLP